MMAVFVSMNLFSGVPFLLFRFFDLLYELLGHIILANEYPKYMGVELTMMFGAIIVKVSKKILCTEIK